MRIALFSFLLAVGLTTFTLASPDAGAGRQQPPAPSAAAAGPAPTTGPKEGGRGDAPLPETRPIVWAAGKTKVLLVGGGSSHDFTTFFNSTDSATLAAAGFSVNYTEDRDQTVTALPAADVAVLSVNRRFFDSPEYRKALFDFAAAGKGIVLVHAGAWYMYPQWPELNALIVGGGAKAHDRLGPYTVKTIKGDHPVMKGVPASFDVEDELYHVNPDPAQVPPGTASIEVLAETSPSVRYMKPHPAIWITQHPTARIVAITIGHDARTHDLPAFKTLLVNAVKWTGKLP
ncbi:MAG: ThuA domain-containing protein [Acidobacteriota bacterium]